MRPFFGNTSFFTRESAQSGHHAVRAIPTLFLSPRGIKVEAINDERFCDSPFKSATNIVKSPNKASSLSRIPESQLRHSFGQFIPLKEVQDDERMGDGDGAHTRDPPRAKSGEIIRVSDSFLGVPSFLYEERRSGRQRSVAVGL